MQGVVYEYSNNEKGMLMALTYLPAYTKAKKTDTDWLSAIYNEFKLLDKHMTITDAQKKYLDTVTRWKHYGSSVFYTEVSHPDQEGAITILSNCYAELH